MIHGWEIVPGWGGESIFQLSKKCLVIVIFGVAKSQNYQGAVSLAMSALNYREAQFGKETVRVAAFERTPEQAAFAIALIDIASAWTSTRVFAGGNLVRRSSDITNTLHCYQTASACDVPEAHCLVLRRDIFDPVRYASFKFTITDEGTVRQWEDDLGKRFLMPCSLAHKNCAIERDHPTSWKDQAQAIAVAKNTAWCPLFDIEKFRQYD